MPRVYFPASKLGKFPLRKQALILCYQSLIPWTNIPSSEAMIARWLRTAWVSAMEPNAKRKTKSTVGPDQADMAVAREKKKKVPGTT